MTIPVEITQYINRTRQAGMPDRLIRQELQKLGYGTSDIDNALAVQTSGHPVISFRRPLEAEILPPEHHYLFPLICFILVFILGAYFGYRDGAILEEDFLLGVFIISLVVTAVITIVMGMVRKVFKSFSH